jgi:hypothetical protein
MTKIEQFIDQYPGVEGHDVSCVLEAMSGRLGQSAESLLTAALADRFAAFHILAAARRRHSLQNRG